MASMTEIPSIEISCELIHSNILEVLRTRLKSDKGFYSQETVRIDTESGTSGHPVEFVNIFMGPISPVYEPEQFHLLTSKLTAGLEKSRDTRAENGHFGLSLTRVQFIEDCENKKQVITLIILPQARYAKICADFHQGWFDRVLPYVPDLSDLAHYLNRDLIDKFKGKEEELEDWFKSLVGR